MPPAQTVPAALADTILSLARVPSFTSYEHRLHPHIREFCAALPDITITKVPDHNLILSTAAARGQPAIALSAHLDKINHFEGQEEQNGDKPLFAARRLSASTAPDGAAILHGLLDDAAGIGIALHLLAQAAAARQPLRVLLSECEESSMFRHSSHLLDPARAPHLGGGIGARRIADFLLQQEKQGEPLPQAITVLDVTPLFGGSPGIALYDAPWDKANFTPAPPLLAATQQWSAAIRARNPRVQIANNTNDYLTYAQHFHNAGAAVPCLALEPAIANYHSAHEEVHESDIADVVDILRHLLL